MRFYQMDLSHPRRWDGRYKLERRYALPGIKKCPACKLTWGVMRTLGSVDVTGLPEAWEFEVLKPAPIEDYERLAEVVKPLCPPWAILEPGTQFGPLHGKARGSFGALSVDTWRGLVVREDVLESLQAAGLRGLLPVPVVLEKPLKGPGLVELDPPVHGRVHPGAVPLNTGHPCARCGHHFFREYPTLRADPESLPTDLDVFVLADAPFQPLVSERFIEVLRECDTFDVEFKEVLLTPPSERPADF